MPIAVYKQNGRGSWLVRVVPNKFPAVAPSETLCPTCLPLSDVTPAGAIPGFGRHEVIIESPRHVASLSQLTPAEAEVVFRAYRDRIRDLKAEGGFKYVQIFKNVGSAAGASLEHVHSQLVALPGVPEVVETELASTRDYFAQHQALAAGGPDCRRNRGRRADRRPDRPLRRLLSFRQPFCLRSLGRSLAAPAAIRSFASWRTWRTCTAHAGRDRSYRTCRRASRL